MLANQKHWILIVLATCHRFILSVDANTSGLLPEISMKDVRIKPGEAVDMNCIVYNLPVNVSVTFRRCRNEADCDDRTEILASWLVSRDANKEIRSIAFLPSSDGMVTCSAENSNGLNQTTAHVITSDIDEHDDENISIRSTRLFDNYPRIVSSYAEALICAVDKYKYKSSDLVWLKDGESLNCTDEWRPSADAKCLVDNKASNYTIEKVVMWPVAHSIFIKGGKYACRAERWNGTIEERTWWVNETLIKSADIVARRENGTTYQFDCNLPDGNEPITEIRWYKNIFGLFHPKQLYSEGVKLLRNNTRLYIPNVYSEGHCGAYLCVVSNRFGDVRTAGWVNTEKTWRFSCLHSF